MVPAISIEEMAPKHLPIQYLLENDYLRVIPLRSGIHTLSTEHHSHDHYEVLLITAGSGTHYINYKPYQVVPGRVYFIHPGQVHLIDHFERSGWLILFGPELYTRFGDIHPQQRNNAILDVYGPHPFIDLNTAMQTQLEALIGLLQDELLLANPSKDILMHYTSAVLLYINKVHQQQHNASGTTLNERPLYSKLRELIETNFRTEHKLNFYVEHMGCDIKKLNRICRLTAGMNLSQIITERLTTEGKILLHTTSLSVKQISYDLGFKDPAFFGRFFKKHVKHTPLDFRRLRLL